jgi:hypothetical protein
MIILPRQGRITQGTIFCGAVAEDYSSSPVWGLVITARCDTAHDKIPIINYLPLVRVEDWLERNGGLIVLDRSLAEAETRFRNLLLQRELSTTLLDVHDPVAVAALNFPFPINPTTSKKTEKEQKDATSARDLANHIVALNLILQSSAIDPHGIRDLVRRSTKATQAVVAELLAHRLAGYYYMQDIGKLTEYPSTHGYVVLLREVHHLPRVSAMQLLNGVSRESTSADTVPHGLCLDEFDFAYPIAEVQSPWIEHLMQVFCSMFGRIGIADVDKRRVGLIVESILVEEIR